MCELALLPWQGSKGLLLKAVITNELYYGHEFKNKPKNPIPGWEMGKE